MKENLLGWKYNAKSKEDATLLLKIYLEEVTEGNREARIYAPESGVGLIRLKFAWILSTIDGKVVLDGGRFAEVDARWNGLLDSLMVRSGDSALLYVLLPKLCKALDRQVEIPVYKKWLLF